MSFTQSLLIGAVSTVLTAIIGWWLSRNWLRRTERASDAQPIDWLTVQTSQRSGLQIALGLLLLVFVFAVFVGFVAAIWPFMEKWLYWIALIASIGGFTLSLYVAGRLAPLQGAVGQRGRLLSRGAIAVWVSALLGLALGAYQDLYAHSFPGGMLDDLAARSMVSVGAACLLYSTTIVTGFQLAVLSAFEQGREGRDLNAFERLAWQLTIYGAVTVIVTTATGFALTSGLLL